MRWCVDAYWSVNIVENKRDCHTVPPPISSVKGFKVWLNRPRFCDLLIPLATNWTGSWGERKPCKPFRCFVQRFLAEWKDGWMMLSRLGTHCFSRLYWKQPIGRWLQCWLGSVAAQYLPFIVSASLPASFHLVKLLRLQSLDSRADAVMTEDRIYMVGLHGRIPATAWSICESSFFSTQKAYLQMYF